MRVVQTTCFVATTIGVGLQSRLDGFGTKSKHQIMDFGRCRPVEITQRASVRRKDAI